MQNYNTIINLRHALLAHEWELSARLTTALKDGNLNSLQFLATRRPHKEVSIEGLTSEQLDALGFGTWSKDDPIRLIPVWLVEFLPSDMQVKCINGSTTTLAEADKDWRFGCIAYGVLV